jgi:hypothetical protein
MPSFERPRSSGANWCAQHVRIPRLLATLTTIAPARGRDDELARQVRRQRARGAHRQSDGRLSLVLVGGCERTFEQVGDAQRARPGTQVRPIGAAHDFRHADDIPPLAVPIPHLLA